MTTGCVAGTCIDGGSGGGDSSGGCNSGEVYIPGQGCTFEFETTPTCDPDSYYVPGQGCAPIFETTPTCDPDSYYVPGQGCTPIPEPEEKPQTGGTRDWPPTCPEEGCENPCPNGGSWDPLTQSCYSQEVNCDVPIDPKVAVGCATACAAVPGGPLIKPGCAYICSEIITPCDVGPAERVDPIQQEEP